MIKGMPTGNSFDAVQKCIAFLSSLEFQNLTHIQLYVMIGLLLPFIEEEFVVVLSRESRDNLSSILVY